ncbi:cytochrome b/b6 domain-containing protein [Sandaracinobacteroides saxicola]|nr:cytochrome b/b6 domain-containing protein [Sandaracinobacteroides saxicola]
MTLIKRHRLPTRLWHWVNALAVILLIMTGLQIFNAHPMLHWGKAGNYGDPSLLLIGSADAGNGRLQGITQVLGHQFDTTGVLGVSAPGQTAIAFPAWATLPGPRNLALARQIHFFTAWIFVAGLIAFLALSLANRHLRELTPARAELAPRHIWHDIVQHARLRFPRGEDAARYHILQKLAYLGVILLLLLMIYTGLCMSPGMNAAAPWMPALVGGRQSARTLHFLAMTGIVAFILVHLAMVLLSGPFNQMRGMITGRFRLPQ